MDIFKIFKGKKNTKEPVPEKEPQRIYSNLEQNLTLIKEKLGNANDLLIRKLRLQGADDVAIAILGIDGCSRSRSSLASLFFPIGSSFTAQ